MWPQRALTNGARPSAILGVSLAFSTCEWPTFTLMHCRISSKVRLCAIAVLGRQTDDVSTEDPPRPPVTDFSSAKVYDALCNPAALEGMYESFGVLLDVVLEQREIECVLALCVCTGPLR